MRTLGPFIVALVSLCATGAGDAAFPGSNGRVVFVAGGALYSVDPAGLHTRVLVSGFVLTAPRWSPDGGRIVFAAAKGSGDTTSRVYVINADGSAMRALTQPPEGASDLDPSWSPDGAQIVFDRRWPSPIVAGGPPHPISPQLYVMSADGSRTRLLARDARTASWSPDGKTIAFVVEHTAGPASLRWLAVMNADATGRHRLIEDGSTEEDFPNWSPDGRRIVFADSARIVSVRRDGGGYLQLTAGRYPDERPAYSPDGRRIVFVRNLLTRGAPPYQLYVMMRAGAGQHPLLVNQRNVSGRDPDWQPRRLGA